MEKTWRAFLGIAAICLSVRVVVCIALGPYDSLNRTELTKISLALASGQGYSNAFGHPGEPNTGPTAHVPPVYPFILSLVYRLCGMSLGGEIGKYALNLLLVSFVYGALPLAAMTLGMPKRAGLYAGVFGAAIPVYFLTELRGGELALASLMLLVATLTFRATLVRPLFVCQEAVGHGLLWGFILATSTSAAPVVALWIGLLFWNHQPPPRTFTRFSTVLFGTIFVVLLPWTLRNYLVLGSPILSRSNLGLELQVSNNDFAGPTGYENQSNRAFELYHPNRNSQQRLQYRQMGEVPYYRGKMQQAVAWMLDHPTRFMELTLQRVWYFWTAPVRRPLQMVILYAISGLAAFGLWRLLTTLRIAGMQIASLWLGFSFIYYFVQFENRYRYPIFWSLLLLASFGLTEMAWWQQLERRVAEWWTFSKDSPRRWGRGITRPL